MSTATASDWLARRPRRADAMPLFCFPAAGSTAAVFRSWPEQLAAGVEICPVQLPGRANRREEPPVGDLDALVVALEPALREHLARPFALFGHSTGALVAFALALHIRDTHGTEPVRLCVAGFRAPHVPPRDSTPRHRLSDADLVDVLRQLGGTPPEVLDDAELMELLLPAVRADFQLSETWDAPSDVQLDCPFSVFGAAEDPHVSAEELQGWREHTRGPVTPRMVHGRHHFLEEARDELLSALSEDLGGAGWSVLVNDDGQYGLARRGQQAPAGWKATGCEGTEEECLRLVAREWTDMRPRSLRQAGGEP